MTNVDSMSQRYTNLDFAEVDKLISGEHGVAGQTTARALAIHRARLEGTETKLVDEIDRILASLTEVRKAVVSAGDGELNCLYLGHRAAKIERLLGTRESDLVALRLGLRSAKALVKGDIDMT